MHIIDLYYFTLILFWNANHQDQWELHLSTITWMQSCPLLRLILSVLSASLSLYYYLLLCLSISSLLSPFFLLFFSFSPHPYLSLSTFSFLFLHSTKFNELGIGGDAIVYSFQLMLFRNERDNKGHISTLKKETLAQGDMQVWMQKYVTAQRYF